MVEDLCIQKIGIIIINLCLNYLSSLYFPNTEHPTSIIIIIIFYVSTGQKVYELLVSELSKHISDKIELLYGQLQHSVDLSLYMSFYDSIWLDHIDQLNTIRLYHYHHHHWNNYHNHHSLTIAITTIITSSLASPLS